MSRPAILTEDVSPTLHLALRHAMSEYKEGYWLYDDTRGMNLAIGAPTKEAAYLGALAYYQKRLTEVETMYKALKAQVAAFVAPFLEANE